MRHLPRHEQVTPVLLRGRQQLSAGPGAEAHDRHSAVTRVARRGVLELVDVQMRLDRFDRTVERAGLIEHHASACADAPVLQRLEWVDIDRGLFVGVQAPQRLDGQRGRGARADHLEPQLVGRLEVPGPPDRRVRPGSAIKSTLPGRRERAALVSADTTGAGRGQRTAHLIEVRGGHEGDDLVARRVRARGHQRPRVARAHRAGQPVGQAVLGRVERRVRRVDHHPRADRAVHQPLPGVERRQPADGPEDGRVIRDDRRGPDPLGLVHHGLGEVDRQQHRPVDGPPGIPGEKPDIVPRFRERRRGDALDCRDQFRSVHGSNSFLAAS